MGGRVSPMWSSVGSLSWIFPSGASLAFRHLQHESTVLDWQGSEIPLIGIDELTHLTEYQFFYLLSRNRSTCGVRPYVRATCNPDADSWVAGFIAWWIDQDTGLPIPARAGVVRWFVRINGALVWGDSPAEIEERHPGIPPKSVTFIPASLFDNPALLKADPGYLANLYAQPLVEQERLLGGNWKIRPASGKVFNRAWFEIVASAPAEGTDCRYWDFAATEKELAKDDPDYTASILMRRVGTTYYVLDCTAAQSGPAQVEAAFLAASWADAARAQGQGVTYRVRWEIEPGSAGKREAWRLTGALAGLDAHGVRPRGDKLARAWPLAAQAQAGNVKLVRGAWNEAFLLHMHHQPDIAHDDIMDAASGAFDDLAAGDGVRYVALPESWR
jgi:predicted phage terminase large subunit-like protein